MCSSMDLDALCVLKTLSHPPTVDIKTELCGKHLAEAAVVVKWTVQLTHCGVMYWMPVPCLTTVVAGNEAILGVDAGTATGEDVATRPKPNGP